LGAGHGAVSRVILDNHPTAEVTVTDVNPESVAAIAAGDLGAHPRATVRHMDATAIDAADASYDLVLFALSFHHLPPGPASKVFAEGTRVGTTLAIIDLPRPRSPFHLLRLASMLPFTPILPFVHDGFISSLRCYSPSALRALARHADPAIEVQLRSGFNTPQIAVATRR
jgi:ubiquinone/menaquinone biosynthesis C-methylase UbiE